MVLSAACPFLQPMANRKAISELMCCCQEEKFLLDLYILLAVQPNLPFKSLRGLALVNRGGKPISPPSGREGLLYKINCLVSFHSATPTANDIENSVSALQTPVPLHSEHKASHAAGEFPQHHLLKQAGLICIITSYFQ